MRAFSLLFILIFSLAHSQEVLDVPKAYDAGVKAMEEGKYDEGLKAIGNVIATHGATGKERYGSVFGHFYYLQGMLHVKKKEYPQAIQSFQTCYEKFPNDTEDLPNVFLSEALAQWAGCLMATKKYGAAAEKYKAALARTEKYKPQLNRLETQVNLSKCLMLSGESSQGKDFISQRMDDPEATDPMKRSLFLILLADWSPTAPIAEINTYLKKYGPLMQSDTLVNRYEKQNPVYNRLASQAVAAEQPDRALLWYQQMISPVEVGRAYNAEAQKLRKTGSNPVRLDKLESDLRKQKEQLGQILMGRGSAYFALGQLDKAKADYLELANRFPNHPQRGVILHNLTMAAVKQGDLDAASRYGMQFFKERPEDELRPVMASTLVDGLFVQGEFAEVLRVGNQLRSTLKSGSPEAEVPAFATGAALYHLGRHQEATEDLTAYLEQYPSGSRVDSARYYLGANLISQQRWDEGTAALDEFLETYESSDFRPSALYFSGLGHFVGEDYLTANSRMIELQVKHRDAAEVPNSHNILGDILAARDKPYGEVTDCYKRALDLVEKQNRGDANVAGYALRQLLNQAAAAEQWELATSFYDRFTKDYSDTNWRSDVLTLAIGPLVNSGRADEARQLLEQNVQTAAQDPNSTELDTLFASYLDFLKQHLSQAEATDALANFPDPKPVALRAWIYLAQIELAEDPEVAKKTFAQLRAIYEQHGKKLSSATLVKLARDNLANGGNEAEARDIYEFILADRPGGEAAGQALGDLAQLQVEKAPNKAKQLFERVLNEVDDIAAHEPAVLGIARLESAAGDYDAAIAWWQRYRQEPSWRSARAEASYRYGECLLQAGDRDEAVATFVNVYSNFPGQIDWSAKAYVESAKIIHAKGRELDALKLLREMIQRIGHEKEHPDVIEGRRLFFAWRDALTAKG